MKKDVCYIVCAGEKRNLPSKVDCNCYIIAVDGGYRYLQESGIAPHLIVGDFDSLGYVPRSENVIRLPQEKDDTDTLFAIKTAIAKGCKEFHIFCGTGGALEHTFANLQCLNYLAQKGLKCFLYDGARIWTAASNAKIYIDNGRGKVSIFSSTKTAQGLQTCGLKYPLCNYTLSNSFPIGINNEFINDTASISVKDGTLLICLNVDANINLE